MEKVREYHKDCDRSGYAIRPGRQGWIVENWSRVQGDVTGRKVLLPYTEDAPQGADLHGAYNEFYLLAEILWDRSQHVGKVLRKGQTVR